MTKYKTMAYMKRQTKGNWDIDYRELYIKRRKRRELRKKRHIAALRKESKKAITTYRKYVNPDAREGQLKSLLKLKNKLKGLIVQVELARPIMTYLIQPLKEAYPAIELIKRHESNINIVVFDTAEHMSEQLEKGNTLQLDGIDVAVLRECPKLQRKYPDRVAYIAHLPLTLGQLITNRFMTRGVENTIINETSIFFLMRDMN